MEMSYNLCRMAGTVVSGVLLVALVARFIVIQIRYPFRLPFMLDAEKEEVWEAWEAWFGLDTVRDWKGWEVFYRYVPRWWVSAFGLAVVLGTMHEARSLFDRVTEYNLSSVSSADIAGTWADGGRLLQLNPDGTATCSSRIGQIDPDSSIIRWQVQNSTVGFQDPQGLYLARWRLIRFNGRLRISDDYPWFGQPLAGLGFAKKE